MATLRYDVDVDNRRAEQRIGAFALSMRRQITQAVRALPDIEIDANSTDAQREIAEVRRELVALGQQRIGIDIDPTAAQARLTELTARLQALQGQSGDIRIDVDTAAALAELGIVDAAVDEIDGRTATIKVDTDRSLTDAVIRVAALGRSLATLAMPVAALNIIPQAAAIAGSLVDLSGVAGLLPATMLAGGTAAATLGAGLAHVADALGPRGTAAEMKKVNEAVAALAPSAREVVAEIRGMADGWTELRLDVQQRLFAGLGTEIAELGRNGLPVLRAGLTGVATELNTGARGFLEWANAGRTTTDLATVFENTRRSVAELAPAGRNVAAAFLDIGTVGSRFLPGLANGVTDLTARFRLFVAQARETGQLEQWIQGGIDKAEQLGRVLGNIGGSVAAFFRAADDSGGDFLDTAEKVSAELEKFMTARPTQTGITALFTEIGDAVDAVLPGVRAFAAGIAAAVTAAANTNGLEAAAGAVSDLMTAVAPLLPALATLAGDALHGVSEEASFLSGPLSSVIDFLTQLLGQLGPIGPAVVGMVAAWKLLAPVTAIIGSIGASLAGMLTWLGASEAAVTRFSAVMARVGTVLPIVGVAVIGLGILYDQLRDKTDELAKSVIDGSMTFVDAVHKEEEALQSQQEAERNASVGRAAYRRVTQDMASEEERAAQATQAHNQIIDELLASMRAQTDGLVGVEQAQARVRIAQVEYTVAVERSGSASTDAADKANALADATDELERQQRETSDATKSLTDRITEQSQASSAAANADVAYQQAVIRVAEANERAAEVAADRTSSDRDLEQATLAVTDASLSAADAARRKAIADAEATGATNSAEIGAQAYKEELIRLAGQMDGPQRAALLALANGTDNVTRAENTAALAADAQRDKLSLLAGEATGPLAAAMRDAVRNFDTLGGAHATAEQKAAAQREALLKLANMASGPLRTELLRMADQITNLPDGNFTVTGTGTTSFKVSPIGDVTGPGTYTGGILAVRRRYAGGGEVMPGHTPGRDVHHFWSPTAGGLHLSGGEAVMRPEWTQAVTPHYVHGANLAARRGGIAGVRAFLGEDRSGRRRGQEYAAGGIVGGQRLAFGGFVRAGKQPFTVMPPEIRATLAADLHQRLAAYMIAQLTAYEAKVRAVNAARAALGGGQGWQWQIGVLRQAFPGLALISGMRPGAITATGNKSYHSMGRAVDVPPRMDVFNWIASHYPGSRELIFSPAGARQIHNGASHVYGEPTRGDHWDHVHWAMRRGGVLPVRLADGGLMLGSGQAALNLSGMPERVLSPGQTRAYDSSGAVVSEVVALREEIRALGLVLAATRGGDTFNLHPRDMQEGVHATRMLLRSRR